MRVWQKAAAAAAATEALGFPPLVLQCANPDQAMRWPAAFASWLANYPVHLLFERLGLWDSTGSLATALSTLLCLNVLLWFAAWLLVFGTLKLVRDGKAQPEVASK